MTTLLRTLGTREALSTYLAMIQDSARRDGTAEQRLARVSQDDANHCIYGWCGQTLLLESFEGPVEGTVAPEDGLEQYMGCTTPEWGLAIHIWQTNPNARGFPSGKRPEPEALIEPPHTHPFDFASIVVAGEMHQSTYQHAPQVNAPGRSIPDGDRYASETLVHVDGVWPPHESRSEQRIVTVEDRFRLAEGDAYFMPCDLIHDVEVDRTTSRSQPAITLFLSGEFMMRPHVYMARSLVDYQDRNPTIRDTGRPLTHDAWHQKLTLVRRYLSGDSPELNLDAVVDYDGEYAFIHQ